MAKRAREQSLDAREAGHKCQARELRREAVGSRAGAALPVPVRQNETIRCSARQRKAMPRRQRISLENIAFPVGEKTSTLPDPTAAAA